MADLKSDGLKASADIAKQMIALSTGAVAFTVTFFDKFTAHKDGPIESVPLGLYIAWAFFGLTILFSVWTLMAITGTLMSLDRKMNDWPMKDADLSAAGGVGENTELPARLMIVSFLIAIAGMIWTGVHTVAR